MCIGGEEFFIYIYVPSSTIVYHLIFLIDQYIGLRNNYRNDVLSFNQVDLSFKRIVVSLFISTLRCMVARFVTHKIVFFFLKLFVLGLNILVLLPLDLLLFLLNLGSYLFLCELLFTKFVLVVISFFLVAYNSFLFMSSMMIWVIRSIKENCLCLCLSYCFQSLRELGSFLSDILATNPLGRLIFLAFISYNKLWYLLI